MCFSAAASFTTTAFLLPMGAYCVMKVYKSDKHYLALASIPFLFGLQQAFEGGLWLVVGDSVESSIHSMALGFLFFADLLWPCFVPLAVAFVEENRKKRQLSLLASILGGALGLYIFLPLWIQPGWLSVQVRQGSILYQIVQLYDAIIPQLGARIIYVIIVAAPLLFSSVTALQRLGFLLLASIIVSSLLFSYAFVSIWCFFAAIISLYIVVIINHRLPKFRH